MNEINRQVARARRRLVTATFFSILTWAVFSGLLLAVIGMLIPKIWHLSFLETQAKYDAWTYSWILGGVVLGLLVAASLTWSKRGTHLDAAVEVDKRFGLKERLSSAMSLGSQDAETSVGKALIKDAESRAEMIDVRDQFRFQPTWRALLPLIPLAILAALLFIPNAEKKAAAAETIAVEREKIEVAIKDLKKKLEEKKQQLVAKGLKDAEQRLTPLQKKLDEILDDKTLDKKEALVKLNDVKKQLEDRRKELGSSKDLKETLNQMKDIGEGHAKKLADAMSKGDMEEASKAIKALAKKLKEGNLNKIEMKKLANDLKKMAAELQKIAEQHEADKRELENQIKKALDKGDLDQAAKLQQQLDEKKAMDKQQDKIKKMGQNLQKAANQMKPGNNGQPKQGAGGEPKDSDNGEQQAQAMKEAGEALEDMAQQIQDMQEALEEMEALEDMEGMAQDAKQGMGQGGKSDKTSWQDWGKGEGRGGGKRGLEKEDTGTYKSKVKANLQQGQTVVTGSADGKNITGRSTSETRELIQASVSRESDPLENQKMSRTQREHAQQYFKSLREN